MAVAAQRELRAINPAVPRVETLATELLPALAWRDRGSRP
jgi:hypothetical protein